MAAPSYRAVLNAYAAAPEKIQTYFGKLPRLVERQDWEVAIAYAFIRLERAHNMALYCGSVKLHRANCTMTRRVVNVHHLTRDGFLDLFSNVFGKSLPEDLVAKIAQAEKTRDRVVHGKHVSPAQMRDAIVDILDYAADMNEFVAGEAGFRPFSDLRGFKGRGVSLDQKTTRWLLKGLGFATA